jgi:hypothetical protein
MVTLRGCLKARHQIDHVLNRLYVRIIQRSSTDGSNCHWRALQGCGALGACHDHFRNCRTVAGCLFLCSAWRLFLRLCRAYARYQGKDRQLDRTAHGHRGLMDAVFHMSPDINVCRDELVDRCNLSGRDF